MREAPAVPVVNAVVYDRFHVIERAMRTRDFAGCRRRVRVSNLDLSAVVVSKLYTCFLRTEDERDLRTSRATYTDMKANVLPPVQDMGFA
jgi:hypothetical protein